MGAAVTTYCKNVGVGDAALLGRLAFYAIMAFVILIALDQLGLGEIIKQTFLILVGAIGLALALAFGIGGAKRAGELLENLSRQNPDRPPAGGRTRPRGSDRDTAGQAGSAYEPEDVHAIRDHAGAGDDRQYAHDRFERRVAQQQ